jgi:predicted TIM-barrel fold metal-dependent hydrolase
MAGAEPFMYSSDFPHEVNSETCWRELNELIDNEGLSEDDKQAILYKNAIQFYGMEAR